MLTAYEHACGVARILILRGKNKTITLDGANSFRCDFTELSVSSSGNSVELHHGEVPSS